MTPAPLVVDTSVAVKWFLDEPHASEASAVLRAIRQGAYRPVVPDLVCAEFANTIWKHVRRHRLDPADGEAMIATFLTLPMDVVPSHAILMAAFRIARDLGRPVYDALFLALSQETGADMVTADERLYEAVHSHFPRLRWIGAWAAESGPTA